MFLLAYLIRAVNIVPDRMLSFDPIFEYRYTKYLADYGHLPLWDELSYYTGRAVDFAFTGTLLFYLTVLFYKLQPFGWSLITSATQFSAMFGALIVAPAYLLAKELSNKYGGIFAAVLVGTAPQILVRTFGSSYDTDQIVLFFLILTMYLGVAAIKKKSIASFSLLTIGFVAFMLSWLNFLYTFFILAAALVFYILIGTIMGDKSWNKEGKLKYSEKFRLAFSHCKKPFLILTSLFIILSLVGLLNNINIITSVSGLLGFAGASERSIVNISIAELQLFNVFSTDSLILLFGRFVSGNGLADMLVFSFLIFLLVYGVWKSRKSDTMTLAILLTLVIVGIFTTTRGIRFTEFTSALFLIAVGVGFGHLATATKHDKLFSSVALGFGLFAIMMAFYIGGLLGEQLGPDINSNWDNAWDFLKTATPEFSLVGTWWDPGHMITGLAERRVIADGAHCTYGGSGEDACFYTINDRITDLGKIMATDDETESLNLIRKYQGDSPKVYWIASDDLIGKFQWLQYFGMGCDARVEERCPLYIQFPFQNVYQAGEISIKNYGSVLLVGSDPPAVLLLDGSNAILFSEVIYYKNGLVTTSVVSDRTAAINSLKFLESGLNLRLIDRDLSYSVWIPPSENYVILIPPTLRNNVFTRMFFLEGSDLQHFKQVFRNDQVKIYEVV